MKKLTIVNKGRLEPEALTLLGASTKRGDSSKIGQFGSGNKYALAYLLKHGFKVEVWAGGVQIHIGISIEIFREHEFEVLVINGRKTSITLDFGYKWTLWQAIRELYSNALDEGLIFFGTSKDNDSFIVPPELIQENPIEDDLHEATVITIESCPEIEDLMFNVRDYFAIGNEVIFECKYGKIYRKHNAKTCIYYRGIRCYETTQESIFDYDFENVEIGEDRLIKYSWGLPEAMWRLLFSCDNEVIIRTLLQEIQQSKYIENEIEGAFVTIPDIKQKSAWKECLKDNSIAPRDLGGYVKDEDRASTLLLPGKLYNSLIGALGNGFKSKAFTISKGGTLFHTFRTDKLQESILVKGMSFLQECGYIAPLKHPIITVEFDNKQTLASISEDDEILISDRAINEGAHMVVSCIIEEHIHITTKAKDCSREFQNAATTEFINYMKSKNAFTL